MREGRDQAALEALWQTRVVIDEICNPDCIGESRGSGFRFCPVALRARRRFKRRVFKEKSKTRFHKDEHANELEMKKKREIEVSPLKINVAL